jgi:hypothetical protein
MKTSQASARFLQISSDDERESCSHRISYSFCIRQNCIYTAAGYMTMVVSWNRLYFLLGEEHMGLFRPEYIGKEPGKEPDIPQNESPYMEIYFHIW